jgi:hypothetical protein
LLYLSLLHLPRCKTSIPHLTAILYRFLSR